MRNDESLSLHSNNGINSLRLIAERIFPPRLINNSGLSPTKDVFMKVAFEIFSDGKFNWGRVVALFYFACQLVIKVS